MAQLIHKVFGEAVFPVLPLDDYSVIKTVNPGGVRKLPPEEFFYFFDLERIPTPAALGETHESSS